MDGTWGSANVLLPHGNSTVFVTVSGRNTVRENSKGGYEVEGPLSLLHRVAEEYGITLKRAPDLFVPFVNEAILPFSAQAGRFDQHGFCHGISFMLDCVTPVEIRPVRID
jgi:hypothetical protein